MKPRTGRYSVFLRPFSYLVDLFIINALSLFFLPSDFNSIAFHFFITVSWFIISWNIEFYEVYRFTKAIQILGKLIKQFFIVLVFNYAYVGFFEQNLEPISILNYTSLSLIVIGIAKFSIYYFLKKFRVAYGGNYRKVIVVGHGKQVDQLVAFFIENNDYGYHLEKVYNFKTDKKNEFFEIQNFVNESKIDEIYCSLSSLSNNEINDFIDFADNNLKKLKFLPDNKEILSRSLILDYYGYIPIVSLRNIQLDKTHNKFLKRTFDIFFSLLIIMGVLSWLTPILALLIRLESKGPIFFKQRRNGLNYEEFYCYKFRSMYLNPIADIEQVQKNDPRITKIGRFIRKTSIDELPQFFNVLVGDMSVVGPRPHMVSHTEKYAKSVNKFMVRHFIKPGITGLAQTNGFRGEVESERDIVNRVKYDIFYVENWSLLLDLKIIFMTLFNTFKGEEKAY